jgi:integrase
MVEPILCPSPKRWTTASINFLMQDEMRHLLDAISSKRDYAIFLIAYGHGLRASEVGMLHSPTSTSNNTACVFTA